MRFCIYVFIYFSFLGCNKTLDSKKKVNENILNSKANSVSLKDTVLLRKDTVKITPEIFSDTLLNKLVFKKKHLPFYDQNAIPKLLLGVDSVFYIKEVKNEFLLQGHVNDSIYYLIYKNFRTDNKKILRLTEVSAKKSYFGSFETDFLNSFLWIFGSSTSNSNWMAFDKNNGVCKANGDMYIGCVKDFGLVFFIYNNCLLGYSVISNKIYKFIGLINKSDIYQSYNCFWSFKTIGNKLEIIYKDTFERVFIVDEINMH